MAGRPGRRRCRTRSGNQETSCGTRHRFKLAETPLAAVGGASALVVATPWPEYRQVAAGDVATRMVRGLVLDANGFLNATLGTHDGIEHLTVGRTCK